MDDKNEYYYHRLTYTDSKDRKKINLHRILQFRKFTKKGKNSNYFLTILAVLDAREERKGKNKEKEEEALVGNKV